MSELKPQFSCPACARAVLNRKIDKCLFCGAVLPAELLLSKEQIASLGVPHRAPSHVAGSAGYGQSGSDGSVLDTLIVAEVAMDVISIVIDIF